MSRRKTTNGYVIPKITIPEESSPKRLPINTSALENRCFTFSFALFDRTHELFNLGWDKSKDPGSWFIELLDCLKSINQMTFDEAKKSIHDLHPIDWKKTNASSPYDEQMEYWQFRINKSKGRVIGSIIGSVFYVIWLDPHHNLTDSVGYGKAVYYKNGLSIYEKNQLEIAELKAQNARLRQELSDAEELIKESTK